MKMPSTSGRPAASRSTNSSSTRRMAIACALIGATLLAQDASAQSNRRQMPAKQSAPVRAPAVQTNAPLPGALHRVPPDQLAFSPFGCDRALVQTYVEGSGIPSRCACPLEGQKPYIDDRGSIVCLPKKP